MVTQNKGKKKQIINVGSYLHLETPNLCEFWSFEHISRDDRRDRGEMYGRPLSQSRYVFVLQNYQPLQNNLLSQNTKLKAEICTTQCV